MRYAVLTIGVIAAVLAVWGFSHDAATGWMMITAVASVTFFGALPVMLGAWSRKGTKQVKPENRIQVQTRGLPDGLNESSER